MKSLSSWLCFEAFVCSNIWSHQIKRSHFLCKTSLFLFLVSSLYVELFREKHQKTQHCYLFLLLLIGNYFRFKNSEKFGTRSYLMYGGRDICGILSFWVKFEVLMPVSVMRGILVLTPCGLIEMYHPLFFFHEVRGGRFLHLYVINRASCFLQNICKFLPDFISWNLNFLKNRGSVTDVHQYVPCSPLMHEWDSVVPLNVHPFHPRVKMPTLGI